MRPELFHIGNVPVSSFWATALAGFLVAFLVVRHEVRRRGYGAELAYDVLLYGYVGGWIGARLALIPSAWEMFAADPIGFLVSGSGWMWYGGLAGGAAAIWWLTRRRGLPPRLIADVTAPALAIGQMFGRIGCQLSGDGDYGVPSTLPWAMSYPAGIVPTLERVHPTPIYEALALLAIFVYLQRRAAQAPPAGDLFGRYLILTAVMRFTVEFVRRNPAWLVGLTTAQWVSVLLVLVGGALLLTTRPAAAPGGRVAGG